MKELRRRVFESLYLYVETFTEIKKAAEKTGALDDTELHLKQAEINKGMNKNFDDFEERLAGGGQSVKKGLFGRG